MVQRRGSIIVAGALSLLLGACSTTPANPSATNGGGGGGGGGSQTAGASGAPTSSTGTGGGGGSGGGGQGVVADPCTLLTQAQVAGVVGVAVGAGDSSQDSHACAFTYHDPTDELGLVSATVTDNVRASEVTKDCQAPSGNGMTITSVSGVGDVACFVDAGILGTNITFATGGQGYEVSVLALGTNMKGQFPNATAQAMEKALALDVVAKV